MKTKKILVIRSGAIGDVIMATPFLRNLREHFPDSRISFLIGGWTKDVLKNNPDVDEVIEFDYNIIIKKKLFKVLLLIRELRKQKFELCFILDKSWMWNLFAFLCCIKERIGFSRGCEGIWNTRSISFNGTRSEVDYNLQLLTEKGITPRRYPTQLFSTMKDREYAQKFLREIIVNLRNKRNKNKKKIIGICPGGAVNPGQTATIKRWALENYLKLTDLLDYHFIIFGDKNDKQFAERIIAESKNEKIYDATGNSLHEAKELMDGCDLIITHDSGSMHIASTTKRRIIALFGPTPANRFCPENAISITAKTPPCYTVYGKFKDCKENQMDEIRVLDVLKVVKESLE